MYDCFSGNAAMNADESLTVHTKHCLNQHDLIENMQEDDDAKLLQPEY